MGVGQDMQDVGDKIRESAVKQHAFKSRTPHGPSLSFSLKVILEAISMLVVQVKVPGVSVRPPMDPPPMLVLPLFLVLVAASV
jgi:hypothetical protein